MRKDQVAAMVEVLDAEYESADEAAKAAFKRAVELFTEDDTWGVAAGPRAYGPFTNAAKAKGAAKYFGLPETAVRKLFGAANLRYSDVKTAPGRYCEDCQHPKAAHFPHTKKNQTAWDCLVKGCSCKRTYKEGE